MSDKKTTPKKIKLLFVTAKKLISSNGISPHAKRRGGYVFVTGKITAIDNEGDIDFFLKRKASFEQKGLAFHNAIPKGSERVHVDASLLENQFDIIAEHNELVELRKDPSKVKEYRAALAKIDADAKPKVKPEADA